MKDIMSFFLLIFVALSPLIQAQQNNEISITWFGHSCFLITTTQNTKLLTDPMDIEGYEIPKNIKPDVVTISHNHRDHCAVEAVPGNPKLIYGKTSEEIGPERKCIDVDEKFKDIKIYTVCSNHFKPEVSPVLNAIFVLEFDSIRVAHLGDLGITLSEKQIEQIGEIDILMIPVGGKYTVSRAEADTIISQLKPKIAVFPMHYRTEVADFVPNTADDFLKNKSNITRITGNTYSLNPHQPPKVMKYIVLDYVAAN
jgi:L-ascorbate metabolism protein UlaG (beta-lactamase superfamily)